MIERLQVIATHLLRIRLLIALLAVFSLAVLFLSLLENPWIADDSLLIPAVLCLTWSVALLSFSRLLARVPQPPTPGAGWRARFSYRLRYTGVWLLALLLLALLGTLLVLTYQLLRVGSVG